MKPWIIVLPLACVICCVSCAPSPPLPDTLPSRTILSTEESSTSSSSFLVPRFADAVMTLLTRRSPVETGSIIGSGLFIDSDGRMITTISALARASLDHIGAGVLVASPSRDRYSPMTCESLASVEKLDRSRDIALLRTFAPVRSDCAESYGFLDDWNKFQAVDLMSLTSSSEAFSALSVHGIPHALPLIRSSRPVSLLTQSGSWIAPRGFSTESGAFLFVFNGQGHFVGMFSEPHQSDSSVRYSTAQDLQQWLAEPTK